MKRKPYLFAVAMLSLCCCCLRSFAASGDVLWAAVDTNGWTLSIAIEGMNTNGSSSFGLGPNSSLTGQEKVKVAVTSMGFDDDGQPITVQRQLVATRDLRLPYPNQAFRDQTLQDGVLINRLVLSDYVFAKDSNVVVTIAAGQYTADGVQNSAATLQATNSSPLSYSKPIANWTWPGWERITGETFTVRAVGFNQYGQQQRPVRLMRFIARDNHGAAVTNDVHTMTIDRNFGDAKPFGEYVGVLPTASLAQGDVITNTFQAFPWIGDAPLDSGDGKYLQPTPLYSSLYLLNDKDGTYGSTVAVVSPTGDDDTGVAIDSKSFDPANPPKPFLTIGRAANAVAATNNIVHARNDLGGAVIYLREGNYLWLGNNHRDYGDTPQCLVEVTTFPGDSSASLVGGVRQNESLTGKVKISNLSLKSTTADTFEHEIFFWMDQCLVDTPALAPFYDLRVWYITRCTMVQLLQGLQPFASDNTAPGLIRGNHLDQNDGACVAYNVCGNIVAHALRGGVLRSDNITKSYPYPDGGILYNNEFLKLSAETSVLFESYYNGYTNGFAVIQNLMECATNGSSQFFTISGFSATNTPVNNILFWHNTAVGRRCDLAFNRGGTESAERLFWSLKNNVFDKFSIAGDTAEPGSSKRTGNWSELFGVGFSGNVNATIAGISSGGSENPEFLGISSIQPTSGTNPGNYLKFQDNEAFNGTQNQPGGGDYHLVANSPALSLKCDDLLPFDLDGVARDDFKFPGAFAWPQKINAQLNAENELELTIRPAATNNILEKTIDFTNWIPVATNSAGASTWVVNPELTGNEAFFRVHQP
jgi:hypothetical protein